MTNEVLVDNLLLTFKNTLDGLTNDTKDRILKERIALSLDKIIEHLNEVYDDVHFYARWTDAIFEDGMNQNGMSLKSGFDEHQQSGLEYCNSFDDVEDEDIFKLVSIPLEDLSIKLTFIRTQKCSLGHIHKNKRFYYYSIPRVMEVISYYLHNPKWKDGFVQENIPNFFEIEP